jgi:nitrate reductase delta subunit
VKEMNDRRITFEIISYCLLYPNEEWLSELPDTSSSLFLLEDEQLRDNLNQFMQYIMSNELNSLMQNYIETFDFGALTNLYITYEKYGEKRERGQALLSLKQLYELEGYEMEESELPDYLPLVLEFLSFCSEESTKKIIYSLGPVLEIMDENLKEIGSPYTILIDSLFYLIKKEEFNYPTKHREVSSV